MASVPELRITPEEYLRAERAAETKSEYEDGIVYAMTGASPRHNRIVPNLTGSLWSRLPARCEIFASDQKVRIANPTRFFYPDLSVVCGTPLFADDAPDVLLNPLVVFEVLSESTSAYNRGPKFLAYQKLESLQEYVLISQNGPLVEHYRRDGDHWVYTAAEGLEAQLTLPALECELPFTEIYRSIEF